MSGHRIPVTVRRRFLEPDASPQEIIRASVRNHQRWFAANARLCGGDVKTDHGVTRMVTKGEVTVAFPSLSGAAADEVLDTIVAECRSAMPNIVGVWSDGPTRPRDLGARLLARGFSVGWKPHWMAMDFRKLPSDQRVPDGIVIAEERHSDWNVDDLPYHSNSTGILLDKLIAKRPDSAFHVVAWSGEVVAGHSVIYLTSGELGIAGIYNVGVLPSFRRRGIGRALMIRCCEIARRRGCHYATLNSAASEFYADIGFDSLGWGQTWWMHRHTLEAPTLGQSLVDYILALARGDIRTLESIPASDLPSDVDRRLPNGMTPIEVAMTAPTPATGVSWLMEQGATLDLRCAWDLGWRERIPALIADRPDLVDRKAGDWQITPLHEAVSRGDLEFARLLLSCGPDLEIKDTQFRSTPLGWARHFKNAEMVSLIESHSDGSAAG